MAPAAGQCPRTLVGLTRMGTEYCAANLARVPETLAMASLYLST